MRMADKSPVRHHKGQKMPDNFGETFQTIAFGNYLKGKSSLGDHRQLPCKYIAKQYLFPMILSKVSYMQTTGWFHIHLYLFI